jgi:hypothetical protein
MVKNSSPDKDTYDRTSLEYTASLRVIPASINRIPRETYISLLEEILEYDPLRKKKKRKPFRYNLN